MDDEIDSVGPDHLRVVSIGSPAIFYNLRYRPYRPQFFYPDDYWHPDLPDRPALRQRRFHMIACNYPVDSPIQCIPWIAISPLDSPIQQHILWILAESMTFGSNGSWPFCNSHFMQDGRSWYEALVTFVVARILFADKLLHYGFEIRLEVNK